MNENTIWLTTVGAILLFTAYGVAAFATTPWL